MVTRIIEEINKIDNLQKRVRKFKNYRKTIKTKLTNVRLGIK